MKRSFLLAMVLAVGLAMVACEDAHVREVSDVLYQEDSDGTRHVLSVYAPSTEGGPWPVAVMIHGLGGWMAPRPAEVAAQGIVVFEPTWPDNTPWPSAEATGITCPFGMA
ncbi:MAG: hypothetical protein AB1551_07080 [Actinomycetota bacterium]